MQDICHRTVLFLSYIPLPLNVVALVYTFGLMCLRLQWQPFIWSVLLFIGLCVAIGALSLFSE